MSAAATKRRMAAIAAFAAATYLGAGMARAASLEPFDQFIRSVSVAQSAAYVGLARVSSVASFEEMRQHVTSLYSGVKVKHSFLLDDHPVDCVPIDQQPSVRQSAVRTVASPPPEAPGVTAASDDAVAAPQLDAADATDALGNTRSCETGSIPMRRVTLEDVARFSSLREFFQKGPNGAGQFRGRIPDATASHKYAHSYQLVANIGGTADLNLWNTHVATAKNEIFTLEQHWYVSTGTPLQTLEGGLQNYPQLYNTTNTVLFIYWTADGYQNTGCYNLTCKAFVQTNSKVVLGGRFAAYSKLGGKQYVVNLRTLLYKGNWWVYINGGAPANAIGYYPGSLYRGGPMATRGANEIDYGGETVGVTVWPPMGSGKFPAAGFGQSSFVKNIAYYPNASRVVNGNLRPDQPSPKCYKDITHNNSGKAGFNTYFFFGGPGGGGC